MMITKKHYTYLRRHESFKHLSVEAFDKIACEITFRTVPKGQILFFSGDKREHLFLIYSGYVKIEQYDKTGSFTYIDYIKENTLFPYGGIFQDSHYHHSGLSITPLQYFLIPTALYETYAKQSIDQLLVVTQNLSHILRFHELRLKNANLLSARERVIECLAILCLDFCLIEDTMPFPISIIDLAKIAATSRETTAHVIKDLCQQKVIDYTHKIISFNNKDFFLKLLNDD